MAAVTGSVIAGGSAILGYSESRRARSDARRAANQQAAGVEMAREDQIAATNRAREALSGLNPMSQQQIDLQNQLESLRSQQSGSNFQNAQPSGDLSRAVNMPRAVNIARDRGLSRSRNKDWQSGGAFQNIINNQSGSGGGGGFASNAIGAARDWADAGAPPGMSGDVVMPGGGGGLDGQISDIEAQIAQLEAARQNADPRNELLSGIQGQMDFTNQGFQQAQNTISPLAQMAMPYLQEQQALLGMGGDQAYQDALSRVADPLRYEQERAMLRNNAALGGIGGNVLSALAEQTRARTEANIGNRLGQISQANAPALNALQQISDLRLNSGLSMADIMGGGGRDLAAQETARRQALANVELGQGSELAQLSQNLGTARSGGAAFAAQNQSPLAAGLTSGLNAFMGMGGMNMFGGGGAVAPTAGINNPNRFGNIA